MEKSLEEVYGLQKHEVKLNRVETISGKVLELFPTPGGNRFLVKVSFPEFSCVCPKTSQPDFGVLYIFYEPREWCFELKSMKYYLNSFRNEGHFHEQVVNTIFNDLEEALGLKPEFISEEEGYDSPLLVVGQFNVRGGTYPQIMVGNRDFWAEATSNRSEGL